ncbi:MLO-like protein 8 [Vitis vinifera]|uniref:MLO-like protein 8 n=1 Tax=Vitis vinifera TaxID=29760 RepID=A0A438F4X1_VITVI|nr:MLO-like protein 8 [Vitis vinifera]
MGFEERVELTALEALERLWSFQRCCGTGKRWEGVVVVVMAGDSSSSTSASRELDQTPTWAVAGICAVMIIISIVLEKVLHRVGKCFSISIPYVWVLENLRENWFTERRKRALFEALEKVKAELMVLGFISLLLTFGQNFIVKICIPEKAADTMLPCPYNGEKDSSSETESRRRLLWYNHRLLAAATYSSSCKERYHNDARETEGSLEHENFFMCFVVILMIRGWKQWEEETSTHDYEFSNDAARFRLTHETSFVRAHTSFWTRIPFFFYVEKLRTRLRWFDLGERRSTIALGRGSDVVLANAHEGVDGKAEKIVGCFFRQFFRSVSRSDYLTLRNGFITVHLAPGSKFNFQKYIKRSLEDDFKVVVGISPVLWASFVIFLLLNVSGWQAMFWASIIPLVIVFAVGTKLQAVLTKMALEITERHAVVQGIPLVQGSDKYFWFSWPQLVLHLIHFVLFQNAFQITYFLWIWYSFGLKSCFHNNFKLVIIKIALGVGVLFLCSYITLPLYALITQMGSNMKRSVFDEQTSKALKKWHMAVKKRHGGKAGRSSTHQTLGGSPTASMASTVQMPGSGHALHRFKTTGHSTRTFTYEDHEVSDYEGEPESPTSSTTNLIVRVDDSEPETEPVVSHPEHDTSGEIEFSFVKPAPQKGP